MKQLARDGGGRHLSSLVMEDIGLEDSGEYSCQPAAGVPARVLVHVLQRETEVQAVLGEGELSSEDGCCVDRAGNEGPHKSS